MEGVTLRLAALKGPTAMGLVKLMRDSEEAGADGSRYEFTLAGSADEVTPALIKGELDMACVPANLASVLYNKTEGQIVTLAVNTLGFSIWWKTAMPCSPCGIGGQDHCGGREGQHAGVRPAVSAEGKRDRSRSGSGHRLEIGAQRVGRPRSGLRSTPPSPAAPALLSPWRRPSSRGCGWRWT